MTVSGKKLKAILKESVVKDDEVIRPLDRPFHKEGGIAVLYGNLAPKGFVVKQAAVGEGMMRFTGRAKVFDSEEEAMEAISQGQRARGRGRHPVRRAERRPGDARDARTDQLDIGHGSLGLGRAHHRWEVLRGH